MSTKRMEARRGSALLAVLWLSAALGAIAFSVASSVRSETERTATSEEDVRAYYLATGAINRAILHVQRGQTIGPDGAPYFVNGQSRFVFDFPTGQSVVEIIPEAAKLDINNARPEVIENLLLALGVPIEQANTVTGAIVDWRLPVPGDQLSAFDQAYLSMRPSFRARHASFQDIEELLSVAGMTPDVFYGTWVRQTTENAQGGQTRLVPRGALRDCVSVYGTTDHFDANTVEPAVLAAVGMPADAIQAVVARRYAAPFASAQDLSEFAGGAPEIAGHIGFGSTHTIYTFRATARMRRPDGSFSDLKRIVSAMVKYMPPGRDPSFQILRWYDRG